MARADLLKKLLRGYKASDDDAFAAAAWAIIEEERKKHHIALATDLARIMRNGHDSIGLSLRDALPPAPKDQDRGLPLLEVREPDRYMGDLILPGQTVDDLAKVADEFRQWDVLEANGLRPPHKLLFCGPPGCGKTATAEAMSNELGLPLLHVRFDAVVSSLLGETASNLGRVFDYISRGHWLVLFDEFDAIGRARDDATEHGELKRVVNAFLQMLDAFTGRSMIVAATNFEQSLDPALWRRFDEILRFERPDAEQIERMLRTKLARASRPGLDLTDSAARLAGMSHAEVERVCLDLLRQVALTDRTRVGVADLAQALDRQERRKQALRRSRTEGVPEVDED